MTDQHADRGNSLNGEMVFPAANLLIEHGVPIIFTTGSAPDEQFPPRFAGMPKLQKPYDLDKLAGALKEVFFRAEPGKIEITCAVAHDRLSFPDFARILVQKPHTRFGKAR